jgi:hypothetical protein
LPINCKNLYFIPHMGSGSSQEKSAPILVCEVCHDGFPNHNLLKLHRRTAHTSPTPLPARGGANRKRKSLLLKEEKTTPGVEQDIVVQTTSSSELETGRQGEENQTPGHRSGFIAERIV